MLKKKRNALRRAMMQVTISNYIMGRLKLRKNRKSPGILPGEVHQLPVKPYKKFKKERDGQEMHCNKMSQKAHLPAKDAQCNAILEDGFITLGLNDDTFWNKPDNFAKKDGKNPILYIDCMDDSPADTIDCDSPQFTPAKLQEACDLMGRCPPPVRAQ